MFSKWISKVINIEKKVRVLTWFYLKINIKFVFYRVKLIFCSIYIKLTVEVKVENLTFL